MCYTELTGTTGELSDQVVFNFASNIRKLRSLQGTELSAIAVICLFGSF